jgi:hypothetical protein
MSESKQLHRRRTSKAWEALTCPTPDTYSGAGGAVAKQVGGHIFYEGDDRDNDEDLGDLPASGGNVNRTPPAHHQPTNQPTKKE